MKRLWSVLGIALIAGCGGGGSSNNAAAPVVLSRTTLVGTWKYTSVDNKGSAAVACPGGAATPGFQNAYLVYCGSNDTITLNNDGSYTSTVTGLDGVTVYHPAGTWTLTNNALALNWVANNEIDNWALSLSSDGKTLTESNSDYVETLVRQ